MRFDSNSRIGRTMQRIGGTDTFGRIAPKVVPPLDRAIHRLTGGRVILSRLLIPTLLLTTTGAKSGLPRQSPLLTLIDGDHFIVVGSNFGQQHHPAWTANLLAHPEATVEFEGDTFPVRAERLTAEEVAEVWPRLTAIWAPYDRYAERSGRDIRLFRLVRTS